MVKELLSLPSCDLLACEKDGNTALYYAAEQGHLAVVQELVGRYTTPSTCKNMKGWTPLHVASVRGHLAVVEVLAQRFPGELEARDENGNTPLCLAALFAHCKNGRVTLTQVGLSKLQLHYQTMCKQVDQKKIAPCTVSLKLQ